MDRCDKDRERLRLLVEGDYLAVAAGGTTVAREAKAATPS
jgi:hypothetical protein